MRGLTKIVTICIVAMIAARLVSAQTSTPQSIKIQGFLNQNGSPANGTFMMTFTLYDTQFPGGTIVGNVGPQSVTVTGGLYEVDLPFSSAEFGGPNRYLEIIVNGETLTPRTQLTSAPFAYQADKLDGLDGSAFVKKAGDAMTGSLQVAGTIYSTTGGIRFPDGTLQTTASTGGGGGTLDQAYDFGGAGAGRTITADAGAVNIAGPNGLTVNGNIGIGTTSPTNKLHVEGAGITLSRSGSGNPFTISKDGNSPFAFFEGGTVNQYRFAIANGGYVGIGTTAPNAALHVINPTGSNIPGIHIEQPASIDFAQIRLNVTGSPFWSMATSSGSAPNLKFGSSLLDNVMVLGTNGNVNVPTGNVGIGTTSPAAPLHIQKPQAFERLVSTSTANGSVIELWNTSSGSGNTLGAINFGNGSTTPGQIAYTGTSGLTFRAGSQTRMTVQENGTVSVAVLQITGGSDIAEPFVMSETVEAGAVVTIDEDRPGQLKMSDRAYDFRVAGIVSGANGIRPGVSLRQEGMLDDGQHVALSGRVYALADAAYGAIVPGDLLTTSDTPGHCMKVADRAKAQGAVIGKAMSALESGRGFVLVLVSLQ